MTVEQRLEKIISDLTAAKADATKVDAGQAGAPGTRIRKVLADVNKECLSLRKDVLSAREA